MPVDRRVWRLAALAALAALATGRTTSAAAPRQFEDNPIGWAGVDGGTTGGKGGPTIEVSDSGGLFLAVGGQGPATVLVSGRVELTEPIRVGSNKTILGAAEGAEITGYGFHLSRAHNVILRNLSIHDSADDAINLESGTHHVWIDHCDLSRCHDGLVDIKRGSDLVTVSWCHFHDHHKTCLLGHSDKSSILAEDKGKLRVTYHHNYFDGTQTRHPRVRVAEPVHVFNNYYRGNEYGVASTDDAGVLVESNYFFQVKAPTYTRYGDSKQPGRLVERNNLVVESGELQAAGTVAALPYKHELDHASQVPEVVRAGAGVGKLVAGSR